MIVAAAALVSGARAVGWYVIADDSKAALGDAMPVFRRLDWTGAASARPTLVVAVPVSVPNSLMSCTDVAFDLPLRRTLAGNATLQRQPAALTVYMWRQAVGAPTGMWVLSQV